MQQIHFLDTTKLLCDGHMNTIVNSHPELTSQPIISCFALLCNCICSSPLDKEKYQKDLHTLFLKLQYSSGEMSMMMSLSWK